MGYYYSTYKIASFSNGAIIIGRTTITVRRTTIMEIGLSFTAATVPKYYKRLTATASSIIGKYVSR